MSIVVKAMKALKGLKLDDNQIEAKVSNDYNS
jgi:hypothetical protein